MDLSEGFDHVFGASSDGSALVNAFRLGDEATGTEPRAYLSKWLPFAPARKSAPYLFASQALDALGRVIG
jgi:hypothetical protein